VERHFFKQNALKGRSIDWKLGKLLKKEELEKKN
jgi:hypothetical protein